MTSVRIGRAGYVSARRYAPRGEVFADALGQHEAHVLADDLELRHVLHAAVGEERDEPLDELLGRARAGRDADDALAVEPRLLRPGPRCR